MLLVSNYVNTEMTYIIVSPDPESDGGDVEGVGDEVSHVPHVAHIPSSQKIMRACYLNGKSKKRVFVKILITQ